MTIRPAERFASASSNACWSHCFERPRQSLVEVVDAEDEPAVGCAENAEVGQMRSPQSCA
jgi:hypothetical protein